MLKKRLIAYLKLSRFNEYICFVTFATLLGIAAAKGELCLRWWLALLANWLAVGFALILNSIEDAPEDAFDKDRLNYNPISSGALTVPQARLVCFFAGLLALILFAVLGGKVLLIGIISLILGVLYSWRGIRLKQLAFFDLLSYCWLFAGLQMLIGYFTFRSDLSSELIYPLVFVLCAGFYGELSDQSSDHQPPRAANWRQTAIALGKKRAHILMVAVLGLGVLSGFAVFLFRIIPVWVAVFMAILALAFIAPALLKPHAHQTPPEFRPAYTKSLEAAAAIAMLSMYIVPALTNWIKNL